MPNLARYTRALIVTGISVVLFLWCIAAGYPQDNDRLFLVLHAAHQGEAFSRSVEELRKSGGANLNRCSVCHADNGPVAMLVYERTKVVDSACGRCHEPNSTKSWGRKFVATGDDGKINPKFSRLTRLAHQGKPSTKDGKESGIAGKIEGLDHTADGQLSVSLSCGECHPDHLGKDFVKHVKVPTTPEGAIDVWDDDRAKTLPKNDKPIVDRPCFRCHLPEESGGQAPQVVQAMMAAHNGAFESNSSPKTIAEFMDAMGKQPNEWQRSCSPACHGEHSRQFNDEDPGE